MNCLAQRLPYRLTHRFSKIVLDYIDRSDSLRGFYHYPVSLKGIMQAIENRKGRVYERQTLVSHLKEQYAELGTEARVNENIQAISSARTFTVSTAHQPNILTGPLYFVYKIIHVIRLAEQLNQALPDFRFVPVFFMGSEDADLAELGNFYLNGEKNEWRTAQKGAVGRMKVDKQLLSLLEKAEGQLSVLPFGDEIMAVVRDCYREGRAIQDATLRLLHHLFGAEGLVVLIADAPRLKQQMIHIFESDLLRQEASEIVEKTCESLGENYKVQANPREINLFYLGDGIRGRIEKKQEKYVVHDSKLEFSKEEILSELIHFPERFSPNVILRGLYQETILPNIAFVGGGGELAYWLQLREMFDHYRVPYPMLILRNSFLLVEAKWREKILKLGLSIEDLFLPREQVLQQIVQRESKNDPRLNGAFNNAEELYNNVSRQAVSIDVTLARHVEALRTLTLNQLKELEKKMFRAEKRKFSDRERQLSKVADALFPSGGLQERQDNMLYYYSKWGSSFFDRLREHSLTFEQEFVVLAEIT